MHTNMLALFSIASVTLGLGFVLFALGFSGVSVLGFSSENILKAPSNNIAVAYKKEGIFVPIATGDTGEKCAAKKGPIYKSLPEISKEALRYHFDQSGDSPSFKGLASRFKVTDNYKIRAGLFVTLVKGEKTRACWGQVTPIHGNLVEATIYTTEDALIKDYRHEPITADEVEDLKPQVTVVRKVVPIDSIAQQQPLKFGLMVRSGGRGAILLPGEASDAYYQLVQCKLKAGIPVKEKCQLYRLEADVYR